MKETLDTLVVVRTIQTTGTSDIDETSSIIIYPNPVSTELHVKLAVPELVDYRIYDAKGQLITQGKLQDSSAINVQSLTNGIYYLKIIGKETTTMRFVKH